MSLKKYIESKQNKDIILSIEEYQQKLSADISSLALTPIDNVKELKKNTINLLEIRNKLFYIKYPLIENFSISLKTGDVKKINCSYLEFSNWVDSKKIISKEIEEIKQEVFNYQSSLYEDSITVQDIDKLIINYSNEAKEVVEKISKKIHSAINQVQNWKDHQVRISLNRCENNREYVSTTVKVIFGESFQDFFECELTPLGLEIKSYQENLNAPMSLRKDVNAVLQVLKSKKSNKDLVTLYFNSPITERKYFERVKRDVSLGIEAVIPNYITLFENECQNDDDLWKVKLKNDSIKRVVDINNQITFKVIEDSCSVKWIEKINER